MMNKNKKFHAGMYFLKSDGEPKEKWHIINIFRISATSIKTNI